MSSKDFLKKWLLKISAVLLPLSIGFIVISFTLIMEGDLRLPRFLLSDVALICGGLLLCTGILLRNRIRFFFASCFLLLTGVLLFLIDIGLIITPLSIIWPVLMIFLGVSFIMSGYICHHKVKIAFMVPAIAFILLGCIFFLFTTDVIAVSFSTVVLWIGPIVLLPLGILFLVWLFRKRKSSGNSDE